MLKPRPLPTLLLAALVLLAAGCEWRETRPIPWPWQKAVEVAEAQPSRPPSATSALPASPPATISVRVSDDRARDYPGVSIALQPGRKPSDPDRLTISAPEGDYRLEVQRYAAINRLPGCLVVVDHWGSDVADCWVYVPLLRKMWLLRSESQRLDHAYLHPTSVSGHQLGLRLNGHGQGDSWDGPIANLDLRQGKVQQLRPQIATIRASVCLPGALNGP